MVEAGCGVYSSRGLASLRWYLYLCTALSVSRSSFQRRNFTVRGPKNDGNDEVAEWGGLVSRKFARRRPRITLEAIPTSTALICRTSPTKADMSRHRHVCDQGDRGKSAIWQAQPPEPRARGSDSSATSPSQDFPPRPVVLLHMRGRHNTAHRRDHRAQPVQRMHAQPAQPSGRPQRAPDPRAPYPLPAVQLCAPSSRQYQPTQAPCSQGGGTAVQLWANRTRHRERSELGATALDPGHLLFW